MSGGALHGGAAAPEGSGDARIWGPSEDRRSSWPHIVVVHADSEIGGAVAGALAGALPEPTLTAEAGEALPLLREGPRVDLCLLEGGPLLPAVVEQLRGADPDVELIALVASGAPRDGPAALRAGCGDYVLWPAEPEELRALVTRTLDRGRLRREHRRLLAENIEVLQAQSLYRRCLDLLSTVDLEPLQELLLKAFCEMADAQSAALWVRNERGDLVLRAHRGLWAREALPAQIDPRDGPLAARLEGGIPFARDGAGAEGDASAARTPGVGFYTPLVAAGEVVGLILLADKLSGPFRAEDFGRARAVGDLAAVAVRNARRFADLERGGLRDRDSPAYNLSYFIDYAGKELYKAHRYGRQFSIVAIRIENLAQLRQYGAAGGDAQRRLVQQIAALMRDSDILSKVSDSELYAVLPETDRFGAMMFERRVAALGRGPDADAAAGEGDGAAEADGPKPPADGGPPPGVLALGGATFPGDGGDFDELLDRCRQRMEESRQTLRRRLHLEGVGFWETVELLLGPRAGGVPAPRNGARVGASRAGPVLAGQFAALQRELGRELGRDPKARGLVYVGTSEVAPELPLFGALPAGEVGHRVYVLGRRGSAPVHPAVTPVYLDSAPVAGGHPAHQHDFALYLAEHAAYAFLHRRATADRSFQTSDRLLVDHLISGLQQAYDLQPY